MNAKHLLDDTEEIENIQESANSPKQELMRLVSKMEVLSVRRAKSLNRIIEQLEAWQNK